MSTRSLRKLQSNKDLESPKASEISEEIPECDENERAIDEDDENEEAVDDELTSTSSKSKKKKNSANKNAPQNIFALLSEEAEKREDEDVDGEENADKAEGKVNSAVRAKKKKKKKKKVKENQDVKTVEEEDEIAATVRFIEQNGVGKQVTSLTSVNGVRSNECLGLTQKPVLSIEHRNLNPENEIRRIFGSRVVENDRTQRRNRNRPFRKTWLVQPKDGWLGINKTGLSMRLDSTKDGLQYFIFEHSKAYQKVQFEFLDAVETLHPENIINIVKLYPYHIDALMQVSEIYKMSEDLQGAVEMIERVLFVFEMSFHPMFNLTTGTSRLDYRQNENRSFFLALFHHLTSVGRRGCWRTALEVCKLLLSLDPENDPLCVLLMIDFYAIRSEQYGFLVRLFDEWESHRSLSLLPNFAFSVPLALFHLSANDESKLKRADAMLQRALIMFPGVLFPLLDKCSVAPDSSVQKHVFFTSTAQTSQSVELQQLVELYVGRSNSCWKESGVMLWLENNVGKVLERVDVSDPFVLECTAKRANTYRGTPRNIHRHIILSEIKEAMSRLPPEVRFSPILSYDPLPPLDAISSYKRPPKPPRAAQQLGNPVSAFFQSLWPSFDPQAPAADLVGAVGGRPEGADLRQGVATLVDAMRHLLDGIRFTPPPAENVERADAERNDAEDEDEDEDGVDGEWD